MSKDDLVIVLCPIAIVERSKTSLSVQATGIDVPCDDHTVAGGVEVCVRVCAGSVCCVGSVWRGEERCSLLLSNKHDDTRHTPDSAR